MTNNKEMTVPLLPLRGLLVYPTMVLHLDVGREKSVHALEKAMVDDHYICLATQKEVGINDPSEEDIFEVGTLSKVKQMLKLPNGTIRVLVEGISRAKILQYMENEETFLVRIEIKEDKEEANTEERALMRMLLNHFEQYIKLSKKITAETFASVTDIENPGRLADIIASHLSLKIKEKQEILETFDVK